MSKKAALELSVNAIVIVILAMTLLGLGLGFIRGMFSDITDTTGTVNEQIRQQILDDLRRGDKKLSFPTEQIEIQSGEEEIIAFGVKNKENTPIRFKIMVWKIVRDATTGDSERVAMEPDNALPTSSDDQVAMFWSPLPQDLDIGDAQVYTTKLKADRAGSGTHLFEVSIEEIDTETGDELGTYQSKTFFVNIV